MAKKYKYVVARGFHYEKNEDFDKERTERKPGQPLPQRFKQYPEGSTVESDEDDLHIRFPNKLLPDVDKTRPEVVTAARRAMVTELIGKGAYAETDRGFLEGLTNEAFARIRERTMELLNKANAGPSESKVSSPLGEDVTDQFQQAYDQKLKVFVNANGKYQVTLPTDVKKPVNKNALTKDAVDGFVAQFLKEQGQG